MYVYICIFIHKYVNNIIVIIYIKLYKHILYIYCILLLFISDDGISDYCKEFPADPIKASNTTLGNLSRLLCQGHFIAHRVC